MASDAKTHLMSNIRKIAYEQHNYENEQVEEIEERIYVPIQKEEWDKVLNELEDIEQSHGFDLENEKQFIEQMKNPDRLEGIDEPEVENEASTQEKLLIDQQIMNSDSKEILATTDESIGLESLRNMSENHFNSYGKKTFIISNQKEWDGRVAVELGSTKEKFELLSIYEDKDGNNYFKHFGQKNPNKGYNLKEKMTEGFYKYKFIHDDEEYIALSREKLDTVRCKLRGTKISLNDYDPVGEVLKLAVDKDIIFVHSIDPAIEVMTQTELDNYREGLTHDDLAENLLGGWRQPEWFEQFISSLMLVSNNKNHPSHLIWLSEPGTGKSKVVESLLRSMGEAQVTPFTGTGSTIKGLVPSFKESPPDEGYILRTQRVAGVDEKMDLLSNTVQQGNEQQSDVFRPLINLLSHDDRKFESGNGSIKGTMSSTMVSVGNWNTYGIQNMSELAEKIDDAYLSRCLIYNQIDSHKKFIKDRKAEVKQKLQDEGISEDDLFPEMDDDFISVVDTMQERVAHSDYKKIQEIHRELEGLCPGYMLKGKFGQRGEHHLGNIVDGIVKYRYLINEKDDLKAEDEDYELARNIFETLITSWGDVSLKDLSETARKRALTPPQRKVFSAINDEPGIDVHQLTEETDVERLSWCLKKLDDVGLIVGDAENRYFPYWTDEYDELTDDDVIYE